MSEHVSIDPATLAACRRGDAQAFRVLVLTYQQVVVSLCTALAGADGEDLAQETFVRVFSAIARFDPDGPASLRSWILVIARRLCQDRARKYQPALVGDALEMVDPCDPRGELLRSRQASEVAAAIAQLPPEQRVVLALREWEGIDYEEIAAIEGIPIGTVRSRLARAREALRRMLSPSEEQCDVAS